MDVLTQAEGLVHDFSHLVAQYGDVSSSFTENEEDFDDGYQSQLTETARQKSGGIGTWKATVSPSGSSSPSQSSTRKRWRRDPVPLLVVEDGDEQELEGNTQPLTTISNSDRTHAVIDADTDLTASMAAALVDQPR